jgi:hypothetical protein
MNLRGKCMNKNCPAYNQHGYAMKKFGKFHLNEEIYTSECVSCKAPLEDVNNIFFYYCQWEGSGKLEAVKGIKKFSGKADDPRGYTYFAEGDPVKWNFLNIDV